MADRSSGRAVTADDPVRIASISKLVTAIAVMRLYDSGVIDLDRDVSDYLGWSFRNPAFPNRKITLRQLLSHQSSLTDNGDYVIPLGQSLRDWVRNPAVWDSGHGPGQGWFHYSNLNFPVIASVMERATGKRFDALMRETVLVPLELDACSNWSGCSQSAISRAIVLYDAAGEAVRDDLRGVAPDCLVVPDAAGGCDLSTYNPGENGALFSPQGGLRISMRDLARIGQMLAARGEGFLSRKAFNAMMRTAWRSDGRNGVGENNEDDGLFCEYGLAVHFIGGGRKNCRDDLFGDGVRRVGHSGDAYGLLSGLWIDPKARTGVAFFVTAVPDERPSGRSAFTVHEEAIVARTLQAGTAERP